MNHEQRKRDVAVLITCHNRREQTLACLRRVFAQAPVEGVDVRVVLTDDASSDGTADAVRRAFPQVEIVEGDGQLFWVGGMRRAWRAAGTADFYLWLNDDVALEADAVARLLEAFDGQTEPTAIVVGATHDASTGRTNTGGLRRQGWWNSSVVEPGEVPTECDSLDGNVVLVPQAAYARLGMLCEKFKHYFGDADYGLRARREGIPILLAPGHAATCAANSRRGSSFDHDLSFAERWRRLTGPTGYRPPREWWNFVRAHAPRPKWFYWLVPYVLFFIEHVFRGFVRLRRDVKRPAMEAQEIGRTPRRIGLAFRADRALEVTAAVADRLLVGLAMFLTGVMVGRGQPEQLGVYTLAMTVVMLAIALQESLILAPYTVNMRRDDGDGRLFLGSMLMQTIGLTLVLVGGVCAAGIAGGRWTAGLGETAVVGALAVALPCVLLREFARRVEYAELMPHRAMLVSGAAGAVQLAVVAWLLFSDRLSTASAVLAISAASLAAAAPWLWRHVPRMQFSWQACRDAFDRNRLLARWIFATQLSETLRVAVVPWLIAWLLNAASAGVYAACFAVAGLGQPLITAMSNLLAPQLAYQFEQGGSRAVAAYVRQSTAWLLIAMACYASAVCLASGWIVAWIYGSAYAGTAHPLAVLTAALVLQAACLPAARALLVLGQADQVFWQHAAGFLATVASAPVLVSQQGVVGAAYAVLLGDAVKALLLTKCYRATMSGAAGAAPLRIGGLASSAEAP